MCKTGLYRDEVKQKVSNAVQRLFEEDHLLLEIDANERSISHRLAAYLQEEFLDWDVDCEYNRKGHAEIKRLNLPIETVSSDDTEARTVFPDIVVHRRGTSDNLLVVEVKKTTSRISSKRDLQKLRAFREQLGYQYALFLKFATGKPEVSEERWIE